MTINRQTQYILLALVLGIATGYACNQFAASPAEAKAVAGYFAMVTDIFLRLVKMIIAPLVFATLVSGLAGMGDPKTAGRIGLRAIGWFLGASLVSLTLGLIFANLLRPGEIAGLQLPASGASTGLKTAALDIKEFVTHVFPRNFFEAMGNNEILQIIVFSLFLGISLCQLRNTAASKVTEAIEAFVPVMLKVTDHVMKFAPLGVFAAVANVVTTQGLGVLLVYGRFMGEFYLTLGVLWCVLIGAGFVVLRGEVFRLVRAVRQPMLVGFSTASSEAAYPRLMEMLERFGVHERVIGFVLPLGYSFNLDGSMIYTTFAALFVSQAFNIPLSLGQQIAMLLVLMVSSKGIAGVPRASLVVVAAVLPMFNLPEYGILLVMGIDQFLDMGRTATNVLGNAIAAAVVAKWEGEVDVVSQDSELIEA